MKKILHIAAMTIRLLFRSGAGWGVMLLSSLLAAFMFCFASSDGELFNEVCIRVRYSLYVLTFTLHLVLMYLACVVLQKEVESRQFHACAAAPVRRAQLWLGKYAGLWAFGVLIFLIVSLVLTVCCTVVIVREKDPGARENLRRKFFRSYYQCLPEAESLDAQVAREFRRLQAEGMLDRDVDPARVRREILARLRREDQHVARNSTRQWRLRWSPQAARGDHALLRVTFFAQDRNRQQVGRWRVSSPDAAGEWATELKGYPYQRHEIKIPLERMPNSPRLVVTFEGIDTDALIFPRTGGIALLYDNGGLLRNYLLLLVSHALQMAVIVALALTVAAMFTYSVAVFVNLVLVAVGNASPLFVNVVRDLQYETSSGLRLFSEPLLRCGLWATQMLKPPPVTEMFSNGLALPVGLLLRAWVPGLVLYTLVIVLLGMLVLTRKELDKILHA